MLKLLRANFFRLWQSKALWLCTGGAFAFSTAFLLKLQVDGGTALDEVFCQVFPFLPLLYAAFLSLFLGTEYQDGTLRNKIVTGHARWKVYAASLLSGIAGCWVILLGWLLSAPIGALKFGWFRAPAAGLALELAVALGIVAALAAVLTLLGMLLPNRAVAAVLAMLLALGLLLLGSVFYNTLCEPEYLSGLVMTDNGIEMGEPSPNPNYVSGTMRTVFQFLVDTLPTGQSILLANQELGRPGLSLAASAGIVLLCSGCGTAAFRRKDLK